MQGDQGHVGVPDWPCFFGCNCNEWELYSEVQNYKFNLRKRGKNMKKIFAIIGVILLISFVGALFPDDSVQMA